MWSRRAPSAIGGGRSCLCHPRACLPSSDTGVHASDANPSSRTPSVMAEPCFAWKRGDPGSCRLHSAWPQDSVSAPHRSAVRRARDDGCWRMLRAASASRHRCPRVCGNRGSAGAGCLPCRGCGHIVSGLSVRLLLASAEPLASRTLSCCAPFWGAPLRDGRPCRVLPPLHSLDPRPRNPKRAKPHVRRPRRCRRLPQPGHRPRPAKPLS
jgi:hypothetical protein